MPEPTLPQKTFSGSTHGWRGRITPHESALLHVTGTARYVDDLPEWLGQLHLAVGGSALAQRRILRRDLTRVRAAEVWWR